jgi:hypothetical protein
VDHFINSLRDELMIVKELPLKLRLRSKKRLYSMPPVSWSNETYYLKRVIFCSFVLQSAISRTEKVTQLIVI